MAQEHANWRFDPSRQRTITKAIAGVLASRAAGVTNRQQACSVECDNSDVVRRLPAALRVIPFRFCPARWNRRRGLGLFFERRPYTLVLGIVLEAERLHLRQHPLQRPVLAVQPV